MLYWYWNGQNLPNKKEKGYTGFGKLEAVVSRYSWIKSFLKISQISQEHICVGVSF